MRLKKLAIIGLFVLAGWPALAVQPDEVLDDPALEARARDLSRELRCVVCQNQTIDDSDAPLARDLRLLVRERLKAGDSDREVLGFVVARYGEFVLLRPTFSAKNAVLWLAAPLLLVFAGGMIWLRARRGGEPPIASVPTSTLALTPAEEARLNQILERLPGRDDKEGGGA